MASILKRKGGYVVRWRDPDGVQRGRTCPDYETARKLSREVERTVALGHRWEPEDAAAIPLLIELDEKGEVTGGAFAAFLDYAAGRYAAGTQRHYDRALKRYLVHLAEEHPRRRRLTIDLLSRDSLETWFGKLRADEQLTVSTARLYVGAVHAAWEWLHDSDRYGDETPRPRRVEMPTPRSLPARAPSWEEMDAVYHAALELEAAARTSTEREGWAWRARLVLLLRFTGLRVDSQCMRLRWEDFDLDAGELVLRGELGKSTREKSGRIIPLSPHLVAEMAGWGRREGLVLAPHKRARVSDPRHMEELWEHSKVPKKVWYVPGADKSQCHHAMRKGFKTGMSRLGVDREVRDFLLGHHRGIDDHYLDSLDQAREAVALIPPITTRVGVLKFRSSTS